MRPLLALVFASLAAASAPAEEKATVRIRADRTVSRVTRFMTGACLEDVNHEVYGGIYSQMVFGESFQEPVGSPPIKGFTTFGGRWTVRDGVAEADADPGAKVISEHAPIEKGEAGVEVFLPGPTGGVAGLVVKLREPGVGADRFIGYEVALSTDPPKVLLGRHRHNWEPIKEVPCPVPADRWVKLAVRLGEKSLEVLVNGKSVLSYEDRDHPLPPGAVGLRTFNRACRFRDFWVKVGEKVQPLPLAPESAWEPGVSGMWRGLRSSGAAGGFALETKQPFTGRQSQRIAHGVGPGEVGVENRGLNRWGMHFAAGKPYEGYLWLRADEPVEVIAALESGPGDRVYAQTRLKVPAGDWQRFDFTLTPDGTERAGRFAVKLDRPGLVLVGHAFLQPGPWGRFKGLPVRKDVAEALIDQGLTVLRYGGSMVNAPGYRWKNMVGPRDRRPPYEGTWYPYSTNGWGIVDFLDLCEAAGFAAVPAFHMDEKPQDLADFLEYVNGPADSAWGRRRVADGHPKPYGLKYLELGNEEAVDGDYWRRFRALSEAAWAKDPGITLVVGDFAYNAAIHDPFRFEGAPRIKTLVAHQEILRWARAHGKPVWFDVHVWNDQPRDPSRPGGGILGLRDFGRLLGELCPGADFKVCVFEENSGNHTMRRGLAHAHAVNELERLGDLVPIICAANCLQPDGQNDNGWDQGLLFLNPERVWGQPSYYVTQMLARHYLPKCVEAGVEGTDALSVTAKAAQGGKTLQLQVVNLDGRPVRANLALEGFAPTRPTARVIELAGKLDDRNTPAEPRKVSPKERDWPHQLNGGWAEYTFPPYSFTILVFE